MSARLPLSHSARLIHVRIVAAGSELPREVLGARTGPTQPDNLFPESRRVRVYCSWHAKTSPLQPKGVHQTTGNPKPVFGFNEH